MAGEEVLVRMEREHDRIDRKFREGSFDPSYAAVAVGERVLEISAERADALVEWEGGVDMPPVGEHLGSRADPRIERSDEHLAGLDLRHLERTDLDAPRSDEEQRARSHHSPPSSDRSSRTRPVQPTEEDRA